MINVAPPTVVDSAVKKIVFKHYRTGEEITKIVSEIPHLNQNPNNSRVIYWVHGEESYEDISKSSIVSIEDIEE
jgi:hypothetical protein